MEPRHDNFTPAAAICKDHRLQEFLSLLGVVLLLLLQIFLCLGARNPDLCLQTGNYKCFIYFLISYSHLQILGLDFFPLSVLLLLKSEKKMPSFTQRQHRFKSVHRKQAAFY